MQYLSESLRLFWRTELPFLFAAAVLLAAWLAHGLKKDRSVIRNTLIFFGLCVLAELVGAMLEAGGATRSGVIVRDMAVVATGIAIIRFAGLTAFRVALPAVGISTPRIVEDVTVVIVYVGWAMLRLRLAGMDLASLVTTSAVITAVIAFSMQDTLGNVLGGLFLELDDSIAIGDWVKLDDKTSGRVVDIRWRHTAIRTRNGETIIVPNGTLMKSRFMVIGNPDVEPVRWRRWIWFNVEHDVPPARVIAAAEGALASAEIQNVADDPRPNCVLMDFADSYGRYALRYWLTDPLPDDGTDTQVRVHMFAALKRAGIAIAFPQYVIHTVKETEARRELLHTKEIERRLAALRRVEIFRELEDEELRALADRLVYAPFATGDTITRQGAVAHWLYILIAGNAEVWAESPGAPRRLIAALGPGSVFGEMGMMTGEPRRATVTAKTDVESYRLDKEGFEGIVRSRPSIAEEISQVLAERANHLEQVVAGARLEAEAVQVRSANLLSRIRTFFGIDETDQ